MSKSRNFITVSLLNGDVVKIKSDSIAMVRKHTRELETEIVTVFGSIRVKETMDNVSGQLDWIEEFDPAEVANA